MSPTFGILYLLVLRAYSMGVVDPADGNRSRFGSSTPSALAIDAFDITQRNYSFNWMARRDEI
jgi:hypothetical protein